MDKRMWPRRVISPTGLAVIVGVAALLWGCAQDEATRDSPEGLAPAVLRRGLGADPETLDPRLASDNAALAVVLDLYEGLTREDAEGRIVPGAAESWTVAGDGLTWTFRLRPGLRWSDGEPLTAAGFAASLQSVIAGDIPAPNAALLAGVAECTAIDAVTLRLSLARPQPQLAALLALPVAAPVRDDAARPVAAVTNGPYRLVARVDGDRIELERNPHYREASAVHFDRVVHRTVADLETELRLYRTGELDLTSEVPNAQIGWVREHLPGQLRIAPLLSTYAYAFNLARLGDPAARLALAMAVDRLRITGHVTGAGESPAYGWVPDGIPGYRPARFEWRTLPYPALVTGARQLWNEARQRGGAPQRIRLCTDASANHRRTAVAVASLWREALGVETEIEELEWKVYLDRRRAPGDCDLLRFGWSADFLDAEAFAAVFESGHPQNTLGYDDDGYDELLRLSRATPDAAGRADLLARAEAQLLSEPPVIPVFFRVSKRLVKPYIEGYRSNPLGHVASRELRLRAPQTGKEEKRAGG